MLITLSLLRPAVFITERGINQPLGIDKSVKTFKRATKLNEDDFRGFFFDDLQKSQVELFFIIIS
jgi:hypothetical protein